MTFPYSEQIKLYRQRNKIKNLYRPINIFSTQWNYIRNFYFNNYKTVYGIFSFIFLITAIEIGITFFSRYFLKIFSYQLNLTNYFFGICFFLFILIIYLILNFLNLKFQKQIIINFINKIRRDWLLHYFRKTTGLISNQEKGKILVKITYHLSLLQTGLTNTIFNFLQWGVLVLGTVFVALFLDTRLLIVVISIVPVYLIFFYFGYIISSYYVAQDQTLYSKILQYVSDTFNEFSFYKQHNKEEEFFSNLDKLVTIDSHFRVRREIFLKFGGVIIFTLVALFSALAYISDIYFPTLKTTGALPAVVYILVSVLITRLLYLSLRIGLFYFPLKLGIFISVPKWNLESDLLPEKAEFLEISSLCFKSRKVRFGLQTDYRRGITFTFEKGKDYLILGPTGSGKTFLANIFAGMISGFAGRPWIVKIDGTERLSYQDWSKSQKNIYYLNTYPQTEATIVEFLDEDNYFIKSDYLQEILSRIEKYRQNPIFDFVFEQKKFIGQKINSHFSFIELGILQLLYCLLKKPNFLIIDNLWLDLDNKRFNETVSILKQELPGLSIIAFSTRENKIINYDQTYNL